MSRADAVRAAVAFFHEHAGYSYDPQKETASQGRYRCARRLAAAERKALLAGCSYSWSVDPNIDSRDFASDDLPAWQLWQCAMRNARGECIASLHGIDFGRDGEPWGDSYARVVHAELADEASDRLK